MTTQAERARVERRRRILGAPYKSGHVNTIIDEGSPGLQRWWSNHGLHPKIRLEIATNSFNGVWIENGQLGHVDAHATTWYQCNLCGMVASALTNEVTGEVLATADFTDAIFVECNLIGVNFRRARFGGLSRFDDSDIQSADFTGCTGLTPEMFLHAHHVEACIGFSEEFMKELLRLGYNRKERDTGFSPVLTDAPGHVRRGGQM